MRADTVRGLGEVAVETVEDARIEAPTDVLMRVSQVRFLPRALRPDRGGIPRVAFAGGTKESRKKTILRWCGAAGVAVPIERKGRNREGGRGRRWGWLMCLCA